MTTLAVQQVAAEVATSDRNAAAHMVLDAAVKDAIELLRAGRPGRAEYRLTRAAMSADRILGRTS